MKSSSKRGPVPVSVEFEQEEGGAGREAAGDVAEEGLLRAVVREEVHDVEAGRGREAGVFKIVVEVANLSVDQPDAGFHSRLPHPAFGDLDHLPRGIDAGHPPLRPDGLERHDLDARAGPYHEQVRARSDPSLEERERLSERAPVAGYHRAGDVLVVAAVVSVEVEGFRAPVCTHGHKRPPARDSFKCDVPALRM